MPIATTTEKNALATDYGNDALYASLHDGAPGTTGANEISGGAPAYARQPITWGSPVGGLIVSGTLEFNVPASTDLTNVGIWSAVTAGTFLDSSIISVSFASQGVYRIVLNYQQS